MKRKYLPILRWALFAALVLLAYLVQTVVLGGRTFWGAKLSLVPVAAVSVALMCGAEQGSLFCLLCGVVYCFTGADMGALTLVAITFAGALAGGACEAFFKRHLLPCILFAALALLLSDGLSFLLKLYLGQTQPERFLTAALPGMALSLASVLAFFPLSYCIAKIGGERNG